WPLFRGSAARTAQAQRGAFLLEPAWCQETSSEDFAREWVLRAVRRQETLSAPVLPALFPIAVGERVLYRSQRGIEAVDLRTGKPVWDAPSELALDNLASEPGPHAYTDHWLSVYLPNHPHVLLENSV